MVRFAEILILIYLRGIGCVYYYTVLVCVYSKTPEKKTPTVSHKISEEMFPNL